jgi:hypothetical protein
MDWLAMVEARTPSDRPLERCGEKRLSLQPKFGAHRLRKENRLLQAQRGRNRS